MRSVILIEPYTTRADNISFISEWEIIRRIFTADKACGFMRGYLLQALDVHHPIGFVNRGFWLTVKKYQQAARKIVAKHPHINPDTSNFYTPVSDIIGPLSQHDNCIVSITFNKVAAANERKWLDMWEQNREHIANNPGLISMHLHKALYPGATGNFLHYTYWNNAQAYHDALSSMVLRKILDVKKTGEPANLYRMITLVK